MPDVSGFLIPSIIIIIRGDNCRADLLYLIQSKCIYILELTVGFESNLKNNALRKKEKCMNLVKDITSNYRCVKFVNLSMSCLGIFFKECSTFLEMMNDISVDKSNNNTVYHPKNDRCTSYGYVAIRATNFIFCHRNKIWDGPDLIKF